MLYPITAEIIWGGGGGGGVNSIYGGNDRRESDIRCHMKYAPGEISSLEVVVQCYFSSLGFSTMGPPCLGQTL